MTPGCDCWLAVLKTQQCCFRLEHLITWTEYRKCKVKLTAADARLKLSDEGAVYGVDVSSEEVADDGEVPEAGQ